MIEEIGSSLLIFIYFFSMDKGLWDIAVEQSLTDGEKMHLFPFVMALCLHFKKCKSLNKLF